MKYFGHLNSFDYLSKYLTELKSDSFWEDKGGSNWLGTSYGNKQHTSLVKTLEVRTSDFFKLGGSEAASNREIKQNSTETNTHADR